MSEATIIKVDASEQVGTALIASDGAIWLPVAPRLWDLATWLWWWLAPRERCARVRLIDNHGNVIHTRAVRLAKRHVYVRGRVNP